MANNELIKLADQALSRSTSVTQKSAKMDTTELTNQSSSRLIQVIQEIDIISSFSDEEILPKRQKLRHVITTSNVSSDVVMIEDFFDTMNEEEIFKYKAK
ncbi:16587_t:CDS:1 [Funneliformis caledonium]|uniref:16587_t:CDS:1 n=1 Tax=Funneliformis caledonium TaxID=1117310 RepID=A0A9N9BXH3_9GLOM|nr:16587_t:CDS:1 [Funneliformis caledonium]